MNPIRRPSSRRGALQSLLIALPPSVLAALLIALSFAASIRSLNSEGSWTSHAYQNLTYQLALVALQEGAAPGGRVPLGDDTTEAERVATIRSSLANLSGEFADLAQVEQMGGARLSRVRQLFEGGLARHDRSALVAALKEAGALNLQARERLQVVRQHVYDQTQWLKNMLTLSGALVAFTFAVVVTRSLQLWRAERLLRAQQAKLSREVSLMASHELRRPLQQLALVADLLQHDDLIGEAERARLFQRLQDSAAQLAVLSDLSRLEAVYAAPELQRAPHDLAEIIASLLRPRVVADLPAGVVWSVDPTRFRQALENLLENALKYAPGEVRLELRRGEAGPEVHVIDHGPGVPPQDLERVFEPFYRPPGTGASGHGLGLAIARRFIRAHGGDIALQGEPGGGTRAVLSLVSPHGEHASPARGWRVLRAGKTAVRS